ncbi:hypothetical protein JCM10213_008421 [Rhodosporidiobolus nylandii]
MLPSPAWPNVYPLSFFPGPGRSAVSYFTGVADSVVGAGTSAKEQKDEDEDEGSSEANFGPERPPSMEVDEWVEREPEAEEFPAWGDEEKAECEAGRRKEEDKRGKRRVREGRCSQVELERVGLWSTSRARRSKKWSSDPSSSIFRRPHSSDLLEQTTETQPNHGYIRQHCPLGRRPWPLLQPEEQEEWEAIRGILRWLYDAASDFEHVSWLLNEAPLPLVVIVRQLAERALLARRVSSAWSECTTHLLTFSSSALSRFTPRERRARTLFQWLEAGGEVRRSVLFHRDGVLLAVEGGQEPWEWAFEGEDEEKVIRVLESREAAELERRARAAKRRKVR